VSPGSPAGGDRAVAWRAVTELRDDGRPPTAAGFETFTRRQWAAVGRAPDAARAAANLGAAGGAGGPVPPDELAEVYLPLARLLGVVASAGRAGARQLTELLDRRGGPSPFVVGVTGSVAVGKSTVARVLQALLDGDPGLGPAEVLSTDAFLYPNEELIARGLSARKGFPESYDQLGLTASLAALRAGVEVEVPVYSHRDYDIVPGRHHRIGRPATLIVEGLNVLQTGRDDHSGGGGTLVSDFLDWSIYVDAAAEDIARWHRERLLALRRTGARDQGGFLGWFCSLDENEARAVAEGTWSGINAVNLKEHIAPTRTRARMILHKDAGHRVSHILVRPR
jgi:type I pantothenate kinase